MSDKAKPEGDDKPKNWWQWILVYPAVALALITALPDWMERIEAWRVNINQDQLDEAKRRDAFIRENLACLAAPFEWIERPDAVRVDATICDSGDLLLRVEAPESSFLYPVRIKELVRSQNIAAASPLDLIAGAFAAHAAATAQLLPHSRPAPAAPGLIRLAQSGSVALVVCQKFIDDRTLLRHVRVGAQCYDEYVDTLTGQIVSRDPTACRTSC